MAPPRQKSSTSTSSSRYMSKARRSRAPGIGQGGGDPAPPPHVRPPRRPRKRGGRPPPPPPHRGLAGGPADSWHPLPTDSSSSGNCPRASGLRRRGGAAPGAEGGSA